MADKAKYGSKLSVASKECQCHGISMYLPVSHCQLWYATVTYQYISINCDRLEVPVGTILSVVVG